MFLNLMSFKFNDSVPQPKYDVTTTMYYMSACHLKAERCFITLDGPFSAPYLPIFAVSSGACVLVVSAWLGFKVRPPWSMCGAAVCSPQRAPYSRYRVTATQISYPEREREEFPTSWEYTGLFLKVLGLFPIST